MRRSVWIGFEPREQDALAVAVASLKNHASERLDIMTVDLAVLQARGLYQRPITQQNGGYFDPISDAPMSTQFAISRFFVPLLATRFSAEPYDWAIFMDCDVMLRADIGELFALADARRAVQCVQHAQEAGPEVKMDGQTQTFYARKNWSSVMLFNLRHPGLRTLSLIKLNTWTGRALHGFHWLPDEFIGQLPGEWNHLVGVDEPDPDAKLVHFTLGVPSMPGYQSGEHADEWWDYRKAMADRARVQPC